MLISLSLGNHGRTVESSLLERGLKQGKLRQNRGGQKQTLALVSTPITYLNSCVPLYIDGGKWRKFKKG